MNWIIQFVKKLFTKIETEYKLLYNLPGRFRYDHIIIITKICGSSKKEFAIIGSCTVWNRLPDFAWAGSYHNLEKFLLANKNKCFKATKEDLEKYGIDPLVKD